MPRITLRQLKAEALQTALDAQVTLRNTDNVLSHADRSILQVSAKALQTLALACEMLDELLDGITINLTVAGKVWPVGAQLQLREAEPAKSESPATPA